MSHPEPRPVSDDAIATLVDAMGLPRHHAVAALRRFDGGRRARGRVGAREPRGDDAPGGDDDGGDDDEDERRRAVAPGGAARVVPADACRRAVPACSLDARAAEAAGGDAPTARSAPAAARRFRASSPRAPLAARTAARCTCTRCAKRGGAGVRQGRGRNCSLRSSGECWKRSTLWRCVHDACSVANSLPVRVMHIARVPPVKSPRRRSGPLTPAARRSARPSSSTAGYGRRAADAQARAAVERFDAAAAEYRTVSLG